MADQRLADGTLVAETDDYTDTTDYIDTERDTDAFPNRGIDGNNDHDPAKGAVIGAVGGAVVGGFAGGPLGAVVGGVAGAAASGAGVAAADKVDNDNSVGEDEIETTNDANPNQRYDPRTGRVLITDSSDLV